MIKLSNIKKIYGQGNLRVEALKGISFNVEEGGMSLPLASAYDNLFGEKLPVAYVQAGDNHSYVIKK